MVATRRQRSGSLSSQPVVSASVAAFLLVAGFANLVSPAAGQAGGWRGEARAGSARARSCVATAVEHGTRQLPCISRHCETTDLGRIQRWNPTQPLKSPRPGSEMQMLLYSCSSHSMCCAAVTEPLRQRCRVELPNVEITAAGAKYYFYYEDSAQRQWADARAVCQSRGLDLAVIKDAALQAELHPQLQALCPDPWYMIGGHEPKNDGNWLWVDGTPLANTYTNWEPGRPDNAGQQDCLIVWVRSGQQGLWDDTYCQDVKPWPFVCGPGEPCMQILTRESTNVHLRASHSRCCWLRPDLGCIVINAAALPMPPPSSPPPPPIPALRWPPPLVLLLSPPHTPPPSIPPSGRTNRS